MNLSLFFMSFMLIACNDAYTQNYTNMDVLQLSIELIEAARYQRAVEDIETKLAEISLDDLVHQLDNDDKRKAFWMNVYNAQVQLVLTKSPQLFDNRGDFFSTPRITIAGEKLSFDNIEHGIIRGSRAKLALGLLPKLFVSKYEKKLSVRQRDGRIHFALNCGAKSCPPVATYNASRIDEQLDKSSKAYLNETSTYKAEENKVYVTALFSWFRGDFGGLKGAKNNFLKKYKVIPEDSNPSLSFKDYDWTLYLGNYIDL